MGKAVPCAFIQEYWQVRSGDSVGLNTDSGWAESENVDATIGTGILFRIRFKVRETAGGNVATAFKVQVNRNSTTWVDLDVIDGTTSPPVLVMNSSQYVDGDATNVELLTSTVANVDGEGAETVATAAFAITSQELELEWTFQLQGFYGSLAQNVASDTLEFRVVESDGTVFAGTYDNPVVTVSETAGYIGGCFVETPNRVGPVADTNGHLYCIIEDSHLAANANFLMIKSTNGGDTWREVDGSNRPSTADLESVDMSVDGDTLHILHYGNDTVYYHRFRMSDHGTNPDTWEITDDAVTGALTRADQTAAIQHRADGTVVAFYQVTNSGEQIEYSIRTTGGVWGGASTLDSTAGDNTWCAVVKGASNKIHIFYIDNTNGYVYHKSLNSADILSDREAVHDDVGIGSSDRADLAIQPVYWDDGGDEKIMAAFHDESDNYAYSSVITNDGTPAAVVQATDNEVDYNMGAGSLGIPACLGNDGSTVYLVYGALTSGDLYLATYSSGSWGTDALEQTATDRIYWVSSSVFTHSSGNGGDTVNGYIYDDASIGGTGQIWYDEVFISSGGTEYTKSLAGAMTNAGTVVRLTSTSKVGAMTSAGDLSRVGTFARALAGATDSAGTLARQTAVSFIGAMTSAGVVTTVLTFVRAFVGAMASSGTVTRQTSLSFAGAFANAGDLSRVASFFRTYSGAMDSAGTIARQTSLSLAGVMNSAGALDTILTFVRAFAGAMDSTGAITRDVTKSFAGSTDSAGTLTRRIALSFAGATTSAGLLVRQTAVSLAGVLTSSGTVAALRTIIKYLTGTLTSSGTLTRQTEKALAGSLSNFGVVSFAVAYVRTLTGAMTSDGELSTIKVFVRLLSGSLTSSGTLIKDITLTAFSGSSASSGNVAKATTKSFAGATNSSGSVIRKTAVTLAGVMTSSGILQAVKQGANLFFVSVSGVMTSSGIIARDVTKSFAGSTTSAGLLVRQTAVSLSGTLSSTGVVSSALVIARAFSGAMNSAGSLVRQPRKSFSGATSSTGMITRDVAKSFVGAMPNAGAVFKRTAVSLSGALTSSGAASKVTIKTIVGEMSSAGVLIRMTAVQLSGALLSSGVLVKVITKTFAGVMNSAGALVSVLNPIDLVVALTFKARSFGKSFETRSFAMEFKARLLNESFEARSFALELKERVIDLFFDDDRPLE